MGFAVHVKDEARFPGKWAFFSFDSPTSNGTLIPQGAPCYTCHAAHGAVDTTFVQFYPTLLPLAQKKGTLSKEFLKDEADQLPGNNLGPVNTTGAGGVASGNPARRSRARRLWRVHRRGRE